MPSCDAQVAYGCSAAGTASPPSSKGPALSGGGAGAPPGGGGGALGGGRSLRGGGAVGGWGGRLGSARGGGWGQCAPKPPKAKTTFGASRQSPAMRPVPDVATAPSAATPACR